MIRKKRYLVIRQMRGGNRNIEHSRKNIFGLTFREQDITILK
jgi:hypothetical protein